MNYFPSERFSFKKDLGYTLLLTLLVLFFYREKLGAYFVATDTWEFRWVVDNADSWYLNLGLWRGFACRPFASALTHLMYIAFGLNPLPYHLLNLILYICILLLLYHFYNQFFEDKILSKIMVLLFATFYLHAEQISGFIANVNLLWSLFGLATLVCFIHYRRTPCLRYYALALLFAILATLSKEASVCLPLLLLAVDYQISYGTFPPRLPPIKDSRQGLPLHRSAKEGLLPHVPFWLMALAFFAFISSRPGSLLLPTIAPIRVFSNLLEHIYWSVIYSLSPCFITNRLTIILAFSIMAGLVWLFYRSTPHRKSLMVSMTACTGFSLLPYVFTVPMPRYFLFSSAFCLPLVALLAFEIGTCAYRFLEPGLQRYRLSPDLAITSITLLILLPAIYLNYLEVRQAIKNAVYSGRLLKEIIEGTARILPQGPGESAIIYVNLPSTVQGKAVLSLPNFVALNNWHTAALDLYYRKHGIKLAPEEIQDIKTIFIDLGYSYVKLSSDAWYNIKTEPEEAYYWTPKVSVEEFDALSKDVKKKLLFFNPLSNKLVDVSGWSYEKLEGSVAPHRDKLNHDPPNFLP